MSAKAHLINNALLRVVITTGVISSIPTPTVCQWHYNMTVSIVMARVDTDSTWQPEEAGTTGVSGIYRVSADRIGLFGCLITFYESGQMVM